MKKFFNVLKWIGGILLIIIAIAVVFTCVVAICAVINDVGFYDQLKLWFGAGSVFASLFNR